MIAGKDIPRVSGGLPFLGHALPFMKAPIPFLKKGYEEHGNMFSMKLPGQNVVVMLGPEYNSFFFGETDKLLSVRGAYPFFQRMFNKDFFANAKFEEYKMQRDIILPCFRATVMPNYIDIMVLETFTFIDKLGENGTFDLTKEFGHLVMNIASHSFFGKDFKEKLGDSVFEDFRDFAKAIDPVLPGWLPIPKFRKSEKAKQKLAKNVISLIQDRRKNPMNPPDFLQTLLESKNKDGSPVSDMLLKDLIVLLVWAGHETTNGHISWVLIHLLQNREYLESVIKEQQEVFEAAPKFTMNEAKKLKRIEWAIKETERMHPVILAIIRKAKDSFEHDGYIIPKGSMVYLSPSVSHKLPDVFSNPEQYDPLRFSKGKQIKNSLIGFGGGMHRCTGINFAYLEMKVVLTLLLQHYDFELLNPKPKPVRGIQMKWPESPCMIRYSKKKNAPEIIKEEYRNSVLEGSCPYH
ncbi:cytochrome P450 [Aquimarina mytili]|uniref:Cytochrome P450 n=1 Tax=Aquimarina mytili TaxID=874423 RepID=A0A936ZRE8_9FLAO|nr:cytochrome P450 [Aquimarina mytili]MBL0684017.1 cytochrome P450 [Aquimarina mytili]